mgnify:CR=1 FL=1
MRLLDLSYPTAQENLAFEEWYFQHFEQETLRIWISPPSVISGKHQNVLAECNLHSCEELNIPVLRRISGGGTVYHDLGNINFSFFRKVDRNKMIDYDRSLILIQKSLNNLGFPVPMSERHDLFLGEEKISGNAQHLRSGRVLHHGTILYDANLDHLRVAIKRKSGKFIDKSVKSVRSPITNLRSFKDLGNTEQFKSELIDSFQSEGLVSLELNQQIGSDLAALISSKYDLDEWNFGYSPAYEFNNKKDRLSCKITTARGGKIINIEFSDNGKRQDYLEKIITGKMHFFKEIKSALTESGIEEEKVAEYLEVIF